jgi:hypothetical protein
MSLRGGVQQEKCPIFYAKQSDKRAFQLATASVVIGSIMFGNHKDRFCVSFGVSFAPLLFFFPACSSSPHAGIFRMNTSTVLSQTLPFIYPFCCVLQFSVDLPCHLMSTGMCVSALSHIASTLFTCSSPFIIVSDINCDHMKRVRTRRCLSVGPLHEQLVYTVPLTSTILCIRLTAIVRHTPGCNRGMEERECIAFERMLRKMGR